MKFKWTWWCFNVVCDFITFQTKNLCVTYLQSHRRNPNQKVEELNPKGFMSLQEIWNLPIGEKYNLKISLKIIKVQTKSLKISNHDQCYVCL